MASGTVLLFVILVIFDTFRGSGLIVGGKVILFLRSNGYL